MTLNDRPDILLLTIDCWRGDYLGAQGNQPSPTPNLDRLAAESTRFERAFACGGWTRVAMTVLFSSTFGSMHGGVKRVISPTRPMASEELGRNGYETAGFTANPVCGEKAGFSRGFGTFGDLYFDHRPGWLKWLGKGTWTRRLLYLPPVHWLLWALGVYDSPMPPYMATSAKELTEHTLDWLRQSPPSPSFLWAHYVDPHWPYAATRRAHGPREVVESWWDRFIYRRVPQAHGRYYPGDRRARRWYSLYRDEVTAVDEEIGRLIAYLRETGRWENTVVIVTGDHGEEFYEHGTFAHSWNQLHDEGVRVPLLIRLPGQTEGRTIREPVSHLDLAPTMLDAAGVTPPEGMLGRSLLPYVRGEDPAPLAERPAYAEMMGHRHSAKYRLGIRTATHTYIYDAERPHAKKLYDVEADPAEMNNLAGDCPEMLRHFEALRLEHVSRGLLDLLQQGEVEEDPFTADEDALVRERLEALGYL